MSEQNRQTFDVVVVGNGALGLSLGLQLAQTGNQVAVVGQKQRPMAASTAAGAMLGCFGEVTDSLLSSEYGLKKLEMDYRAKSLWPTWAEALNEFTDEDRPLVTADGTVVMLNTVGLDGVDDANYDAIRAALEMYSEPYDDIDPHDIDWLDPDPLSRPLRAMHIPGEQAVDSGVLLQALSRAFVSTGGVEVTDEVTGIRQHGSAVTGVDLNSGMRLITEKVVLASGARTQELLDTVPDVAAQIPRICAGVGVSAVLRTDDSPGPAQVLRTPNRAFACGLHLVPRGPGELYIGATNIIEPAPIDTPVVRESLFLLNCATHQIRRDLWKAGLKRLQIGNRPVALDGYPLLGQTTLSGLWMMTGTYRDGLHLSPFLAKEFASRLNGEAGTIDIEEFGPVRKPLQTADRNEIVETAVMHMLATGYEYDWRIPVEWPRMISNHLRLAFERFADELDPDFTPPPEILAKARVDTHLKHMLEEYYAACRHAVSSLP